jgi:DNA-binding CsgD family transcriptional regulator/uncharacterized glyoxalase superfamily protein PhnB
MTTTHHRRRNPRGRPKHPDVLTPTEWSVLLRVREGLTNGEIAQLRDCRVDTVKYHVANIIAKLQLADREALARWRGRPLEDDFMPGIDLRTWKGRSTMPSTTTSKSTITGISPMFLVDDVAKSAEWYRDVLGFEIGEYFRERHNPHEEPHDEHAHDLQSLGVPVFVMVHRDGYRLKLGKTVERGHGVLSNYDFKQLSCDAYFWATNVEAIYEQAKTAGGTFVEHLVTQPYGLKEFRIKDCDGRVLTFGGPVE